MTTFIHLDAQQVGDVVPRLCGLYAEVFSLPPYNEGPEMADKFVGWILDESHRPGFSLVVAYDDYAEVIGFAYGYTKTAGEWWRGADSTAPDVLKRSDKFAVMEWAVSPSYRSRGIGRRLMDDLLANRPERFATLTVNPRAIARSIYQHWGWRQVGSLKHGKNPAMDIMVADLPPEYGMLRRIIHV